MYGNSKIGIMSLFSAICAKVWFPCFAPCICPFRPLCHRRPSSDKGGTITPLGAHIRGRESPGEMSGVVPGTRETRKEPKWLDDSLRSKIFSVEFGGSGVA